ncbi:hypothetical protein EMCRGX_G007757 [Ephydatia muelleri]
MSARKHTNSVVLESVAKKRQVTVSTFEKWQREYDRDHQTLTWLKCEKDRENRSLVGTLWCHVCREYKHKICSMKSYSDAWISGSTNQRTTNVLEHAASDQHKAAMTCLRTLHAKAKNEPVVNYAPIASCLMTMQEPDQAQMRRKFDTCYLMAKEGIAFEKFPELCDLEERHDVDIGHAYRTAPSAQSFTYYIAEAQRQTFREALSKKLFYILMDGSTDAGKLEQELVVVLTCWQDDTMREMKSSSRYLHVTTPARGDAEGLMKALSECLSPLGVTDLLDQAKVLGVIGMPVLVSCGTDGASVNIAQMGIRGRLQTAHPWLAWSWCYAHRLELACRDAFTSVLFKDIEEMLLRLYYLYEKSPKKVRELGEIVEDLRHVFEFPKGGDVPIRSQGSRWIDHKRKALQRVVDRYGAYIAHLTTLAEDPSVKPDDRAKLNGYLKKWMQFRIIFGCALYVDVLKAPSLLSQSLQSRLDPVEWPTVCLLLKRIKNDGMDKLYQGSVLKDFKQSIQQKCAQDALNDLTALEEKMRERLAWSDTKLLRSLFVFLETQSWMKRSGEIVDPAAVTEKDCSIMEFKDAIEHISNHFRLPLEAKGVSICSLSDEVEEIVEYARSYLDLSGTEFKKIWYTLFTCSDARKWPNMLSLFQLAFCLPFSNGRVEQMFSCLKAVKTDRRTALNNDTLNDLLEVYIVGPPLSSFNADAAIKLWWQDCSSGRRPNQQSRESMMLKKNNTLKKLNLEKCELQPEGLEEVMEGVEVNTKLETLSLSENIIDNKRASYLGMMLKGNTTLKELDLSGCELQPEGLEEVIKGFDVNTKLETLDLSENIIENKSASCLGMMLKENNTLKELNLQHCGLQPEGFEEVLKGVEVNTKFETLNLSVNIIDNKRALCLGMMLKGNTALKKLNLRKCGLQPEGLEEVIKVVQGNTKLETLNLSENIIDNKRASYLAHALKHNTTLSELWLWGCSLRDEAICELCGGLKWCRLKILGLVENPLRDQGAKGLADVLKDHPTLEELHLWKCEKMSDDVVQQLMDAMMSNTRVKLTLPNKYDGPSVSKELVGRITFIDCSI